LTADVAPVTVRGPGSRKGVKRQMWQMGNMSEMLQMWRMREM
jgi:hypothetical protein